MKNSEKYTDGTPKDAASEQEGTSCIQFGGFTLDLQRRALLRGEAPVHLTVKPLETLIFLVENRGRTIAKQELLKAVWKDTFVTENNLAQAIREIRRALGDNPEQSRFVQTVARVGYRFVGELRPGRPALLLTRQERSSPIWVFSLLALVMAAIVLVWRAPPQRPPAAPPTRVPILLRSGVISAVKPALSPDGKLLLFVAHRPESPGVLDLYMKDAAGESGAWITQQARASGDLPAFTNDGSTVAFSRYRSGNGNGRLPDVWKVPSAGGPLTLYIHSAIGAGFSRDGRWVAYTKCLPSSRPVWVSPADDPKRYREIAAIGFVPRWSPDGKWIAYTTSNPEGGTGDLWIVRPDNPGMRKNLTSHPQQMYGLTWTADSRALIYASNPRGPFELWRVPITGEPAAQLYADLDDLTSPQVNPEGNLLVFCKGRQVRNLMILEGQFNRPARKVTEDEYHHWPRLSPSGQRLASVLQTRSSEMNYVLSVTNVATGERYRVDDHPVRHPCWLDEQDVAYLKDTATGDTEALRVSFSGGASVPITRFSGRAEWLALDADRRKMAVVLTGADGRQKVVVRQMDRGVDRTVAQGGRYEHLRWLPGGKMLSWSGPERAAGAENAGVWLADPERSAPRQLIEDGYNPVWTADAGAVYYSRIGEYSGLWRFEIASRTATKIRDWRFVGYHDIVGERLIYTQDSNSSQIYSMPLSPGG
jgi:DNA-binding winged helix-turn-helix (wHTH) protein/Tol biopolymer transport system component